MVYSIRALITGHWLIATISRKDQTGSDADACITSPIFYPIFFLNINGLFGYWYLFHIHIKYIFLSIQFRYSWILNVLIRTIHTRFWHFRDIRISRNIHPIFIPYGNLFGSPE
jgi:hypothetical protein